MSQSIESLAQKRQRWIDVNRENNFEEGIKRLLTELYPDNAHFIYELLQNAEDPRASAVRFFLSEKDITFEHNGERLFDLEDIASITSIGVSTKRDDPTSIGKFGVGFKAVFAYTKSPEIHSGDFHFRIQDLVVPVTNGIRHLALGGKETRFIFPFDHPTKRPPQAVEEVERGLRALADNSLLFLRHIRLIEYTLLDGSLGSLKRIDHENGHVEVHVCHPGGSGTISHWLCFQKNVEIIDDDSRNKVCRIAVAYSLQQEDKKNKRGNHWKITPLNHGQVSIYFPAEKETSSLKFHFHAPFASTVARDSVRDCRANCQLRDYIADLVVESIFDIRERGMLTMGFLSVLPNPTDNLSPFYDPIRKAIVRAFNNKPLTPTRSGVYSPATNLCRGPARIAEVIADDDLSFLKLPNPPLWAANPPQQNQREERFLDSLEIDKFEWTELIETLSVPHSFAFDDVEIEENNEHRRRFEEWIHGKEDSWMMRFYALLGEACDSQDECMDANDFRIVRVERGQGHEHVLPREAFFPPQEETTPPRDIRFVKPTVFNSGRSETQKKFAVSFLRHIGVRPFDEKAAIELKLNQYNKDSLSKVEDWHFRDLKLFIEFWKKNSVDTKLFTDHTFLLGISKDKVLVWCSPKELCLDSPYIETGLAESADVHGKKLIWGGYKEKLSEPQLASFITFLGTIGVMNCLSVEGACTYQNLRWKDLRKDSNRQGVRRTNTEIDEDYTITNLDKYLSKRLFSASRLVWNTLIRANSKTGTARYRPNQQYPIREADSQLVCCLKEKSWVPDNSGVFRKPEEMFKDALRKDFPYDDRNGLLTAIGFGKLAKIRSEEFLSQNNYAQKLGFESADEAEKMVQLSKLIRESGQSPDSFIAQFRPAPDPKNPSFPSNAVTNPEQRQERLREKLSDAPEKEYEKRERNVRTTKVLSFSLFHRKLTTLKYINFSIFT